MFRKSESDIQLDLFSSAGELMRGTTGNYYQREDSWHNLFRREVLMRIDEEIFKPLYCNNYEAVSKVGTASFLVCRS